MASSYEVVDENAERGNVLVFDVQPVIPFHEFGDVVYAIDRSLYGITGGDAELEITPTTNTDTLEVDSHYHRIVIDTKNRTKVKITFTHRHERHAPFKEDRDVISAVVTEALANPGTTTEAA